MLQTKNNSEWKYLDAKKRIRKQISEGSYDQKLPGERILAQELGYSYLTIRQAVNELVEEGVLYRQPRKGTYISNRDIQLAPNSIVAFYLHRSHKHGISSPYYSRVFKNIQKAVTRKRLNLLYLTDVSEIDPKKLHAVIAAVFPENESEVIQLASQLPVVLIDNEIKGHNIPAVLVDDFNATYRAVEYALELGHRRIGYICGRGNSSVALKRLAAYRTALLDYGIKPDDSLIYHGDYEFESGYQASGYFGKRSLMPSFVHCANDLMAMGLIKGLFEKGVKVPDDISVSGFDNIEGSDRCVPALTTLAVDYKKMGTAVVETFLKVMICDPDINHRVIIPAELKIRESTIKYSS